MKKLYFLLLLLLVTSKHQLVAQIPKNLKAGYIIPAQGDTVRGYLASVPRFVSSIGVVFQPTVDGIKQTYGVKQLRGFGTTGGKTYVARPVLLSSGDTLQVFLEHLVVGTASLYRLDYELQSAPDPLSMETYVSTFYYLGLRESNLILLKEGNYQAVLQSVASSCSTAPNWVRNVRYDEASLVAALLRYNRECQQDARSADLRPERAQQDQLRMRLSLRVGVASSKLYYDADKELGQQQTKAAASPVFDLRLSFSNQKPFSIETGLQYVTRKSTADKEHTVPAGFRNVGQQLTLRSAVQHRSIQTPFLLRYTYKRGQVQPYVLGGGFIGANFTHRITYSRTTFVVVTPQTVTSAGVYEQGQESYSDTDSWKSRLVLGGRFGGGISLSVGRVAPVLELYYERGFESSNTNTIGTLHHQSIGGLVGLAF